MIYLTSFFKIKELPKGVIPYSAAVYQPKGFSLEKVAWTDIRKDGKWIRPREFLDCDNPLHSYRAAMLDLYGSRIEEAKEWAAGLTGPVALCCWCPYDRAAKRQIETFGSFVCHTAVLSEFCSQELGLPVWEDADRRRMSVLTQT